MKATYGIWFLAGVLAAWWLLPEPAFASGTNTIKELSTGVERVAATMSGPVLKALSAIAIVAGGVMWALGSDMNNMLRSLAILFMALGLAGGATSLTNSVFGITGADLRSGGTLAQEGERLVAEGKEPRP